MYGWSNTIFSASSIVFIIIIFLSWLVLRCFRVKSFGCTLAVAHFLFITIFAILHYQSRFDGQAGFGWFIPYQYDLPVSLLWLKTFRDIGGILCGHSASFLYKELFGSYFYFGVFGTVQYYIFGRIIDYLIIKWEKRNKVLNA